MSKLTIQGPSSSYPNNKALYIRTNGESRFYDQVLMYSDLNSGYGIAFAGQGHHRGGLYAENYGGSNSIVGQLTLWARGSGNIIMDGGKVGIGTTSPNYKLDVQGTIRAQELKVDMQGADFVFEDNYQLRSLEEVETFVQENKHLPDVAPAKEMQENGVNQSEMNQKLLQKIEELTLYVIEIKKEVRGLKQENVELKKHLNHD